MTAFKSPFSSPWCEEDIDSKNDSPKALSETKRVIGGFEDVSPSSVMTPRPVFERASSCTSAIKRQGSLGRELLNDKLTSKPPRLSIKPKVTKPFAMTPSASSPMSVQHAPMTGTAPSNPHMVVPMSSSDGIQIPRPHPMMNRARTEPVELPEDLVFAARSFPHRSKAHSHQQSPNVTTPNPESEKRSPTSSNKNSPPQQKLWDAQADAVTARAEALSLQEALKREREEVSRLKAEMARLLQERENLRALLDDGNGWEATVARKVSGHFELTDLDSPFAAISEEFEL